MTELKRLAAAIEGSISGRREDVPVALAFKPHEWHEIASALRQLEMANLALNAAATSFARVSLDGPSARINDRPERAGRSIRRGLPKGSPGR